MTARHAGALVVAAVLLSSVAAVPASAFLCTQTDQGASLFWDTRTLTLRASDTGPKDVTAEDLHEALVHGGTQWTIPDCSDFAFDIGPPTSDRRVGFDWRAGSGSPSNVNLVVFRNETAGDPQDEWLHAGTALAITTVTFLRSTGRIVDADIEVNDAGFEFTACDPPACAPVHDLKNTLTHELGHALGLDHPPSFQPGAESATMFASAPSGDLQKRELAFDDVEGVCTLYPPDAPPGFCGQTRLAEPPRVSVEKVGCTQTTPTYTGVLGGLAALLAARRRRRSLSEGVTVRSETGAPPRKHAI